MIFSLFVCFCVQKHWFDFVCFVIADIIVLIKSLVNSFSFTVLKTNKGEKKHIRKKNVIVLKILFFHDIQKSVSPLAFVFIHKKMKILLRK